MSLRKLTITSSNISAKQWTNLLIELNLIKEAWKPYAKLELQAPGLRKVVKLGAKKYDAKD